MKLCLFRIDLWKQCSHILIAIYKEKLFVALFQKFNSRALLLVCLPKRRWSVISFRQWHFSPEIVSETRKSPVFLASQPLLNSNVLCKKQHFMSQFPKFHDKLSESFLISFFFTLCSKVCHGNSLCSALPVTVSPHSEFLLSLENRTCCVWRDHLSAKCIICHKDLILKTRCSPLASS